MYRAITEDPVDGIAEGEVEETDSLMTTDEVASLLQVHISTVRKWSNLGILESFLISPRSGRRFRKRDLITFLLK